MRSNTKKMMSLIMALLLCFSVFPVSALAEEAPETVTEEETAATEESSTEEALEDILEEEIAEAESELPGEPDSALPDETVSEDAAIETSAVSSDAADAITEEPPDRGEMGEEETVTETIEGETETVCDPDAEADNDALFQAYFENLLMPRPRLRRPVGGSNLSGVDLTVYGILSEKTNWVAQYGGSTVFAIPLEDIGTQLTWTKEELGGIPIISDGSITPEAKAAVSEHLDTGNMSVISSALAQDYPYGMFWYDKTTGIHVTKTYKLRASSKSISISSGTVTYSFSVSVDYGSDYSVDPTEVQRAQTAAENARAIVRTYAESPDFEKLTAYKDEICALASYNSEAAGGGYPYGDPWQAIYVFDGDPETKVVCEGYSKAFEYLCDMSEFVSPLVSCISVTGWMDGSNHMWNIVTLADGMNYLADVTNSSTGSARTRGQLFLVGYTAGSVRDGYTFGSGGEARRYVYSENTLALMTEAELTLVLQRYEITIADSTNGSVNASVDGETVSTAAYGSTVSLTAIPDPGFMLDSLTVTDSAGNEITVTDNKFVMPARSVTVTAVFKVLEITFETTLNMANFTGIFVYIGLAEGEDAADYTVEISGASYRKSYAQDPVALNTLEKGSGARANMYRLEAAQFGSPEMTDEVTVTVRKNGEVMKEQSFSIKTVAEEFLASGLTQDQIYLVKGLQQYGYYGHIMFKNPLPLNPVIDGAPALTAIPSSFAPKNDPTGFGAYVTNFRDALDLDARIAMNLYFTLADGYSMNDFSFSVKDKNGSEYTNVSIMEDNGNRVLVKIGGIKSPQMDDNFTVTMTLKSDRTKTATWTRSVITCAYTGSARTSGDGVKFLQALYQYYVYANRQWPWV